MKQLAIKGHHTRGEEVIEILKMLGGVNYYGISASNVGLLYTIRSHDNFIIGICPTSTCVVFTLESFLEKFPYKVGDKVIDTNGLHGTIVAMSWGECNCTVRYTFEDDEVGTHRHGYTALMLKPYIVDTGCCLFPTTEPSYTLSVGSIKDMKRSIVFSNDSPDETELVLGDNYEVKVKDGKTYVVKKKPKYPKTYEECCNVLQMPKDESYIDIDVPLSYNKVLKAFTQLLICRDAYWKIAGDWKPNFTNQEEKFIIANYYGKVYPAVATNYNRVLIFPTEEMRDAFYENFKELIEECKEYL